MRKKIKKDFIINIIKSKIFERIIFIILILFLLQVMFYYLAIKKIGFFNWFMINSCVSIALPIYFLGYLFNNKIIKVISAVFMLGYTFIGGIVLYFDYGLTSKVIIENIDKIFFQIITGAIIHIIMIILSVTIIINVIQQRKIKKLIIGLVFGILFFVIFFVNKLTWHNNNPEIIKEFLLNIKGV
jgi:hypothetical protein